jgi:hypothetical protein
VAWFAAAALGLSVVWYVRDWVLAGDPLFPETVRIGSWLLFPGLGGSVSVAEGPDYQSLLGTILHGGGTSAAEWFGSAVASFGLCFVALVVNLPLAMTRRGRARMLFGLGAACTVAYAMSPFTGSVQDVFGAMRYLLPGVAFGVLGLAAVLPRRWLPVAAGAALVVNGVEVGLFEIAARLPVTTLVVASAASLILLALLQVRGRAAPPGRTRWLRGATLLAGLVALVTVTAHLQPAQGPTAVDHALAASRDLTGRVVVMDVDNVTAILGPDLDVNIVAAGTGPPGAETVISDPDQLTTRIASLRPVAVVVGDSGLVNSIPPGWKPPSTWHRVGREAGAVVYEP